MFEVIGERINTSRKKVQAAVADRDADYILDDVKQQLEAGANFIDVNAGARIGHETEDMRWLIDTIQPIVTVPLTLDKNMSLCYCQCNDNSKIEDISTPWHFEQKK